MKPKIYIDGKEGTTGLQIYERLGGRDDIELLLIDEDKRKDIEERRKFLNAADIVFLCLPMFMLTYVFEMFCSVAGKPGFGFLSSLTAGVVNIGLDAVLMGVFGMGIEAAATATCIAEYSSATLMVVLFARGKVGVLKLVRPRWVQGVLPRSIVNGVSEMVGCAAM